MKKIIISVLMIMCGSLVFGQSDMASIDKIMTRADMAIMVMSGLVPMRFLNAVDGKSLQSASVDITGIGTFTTDNRGIITFPQKYPDGTYTMTVYKNGFITTPIDFKLQTGIVIFNWFSVSPEIPNKDFRIVLDWGETPADLDLHFEKANGYHISYWNMKASADGNVTLDRDDRTGFGPETITIEETDIRSTYSLYIHDYTNRNSAASKSLSSSGAVIRVYSRNHLLQTFHVPENLTGRKWTVFNIVQNKIVPVNAVE
jgi:hypothetical protein